MNDTDGDLYRLRPTLAKIGKRYYWAVWRFTTPDEGQLPARILPILTGILFAIGA